MKEMNASWPPTVTLVLSSEVGAFTPLKSVPVQESELVERFDPKISIHEPGAMDLNWPKELALTTPPDVIEGGPCALRHAAVNASASSVRIVDILVLLTLLPGTLSDSIKNVADASRSELRLAIVAACSTRFPNISVPEWLC